MHKGLAKSCPMLEYTCLSPCHTITQRLKTKNTLDLKTERLKKKHTLDLKTAKKPKDKQHIFYKDSDEIKMLSIALLVTCHIEFP